MWPLFLGTETPAPLMLPDSVQKAHFAETVHKIANLDFETVLPVSYTHLTLPTILRV